MGFLRDRESGFSSDITKEALQVFADAFGIREVNLNGSKVLEHRDQIARRIDSVPQCCL